MNENEVDKFFKDLPSEDKTEVDIFDDKPKAPAAEIPEKDDEPRKSRKHRRWEAKLEERERELIAREARLQGLAEARKEYSDTITPDVDPRLLQMYGTDEKGKEAARLHTELLNDYTARGKEEALREIEERQERERAEQAQYESYIDSQLESIEDEFNVDVTSDSPAARKARREFLEMVQKLSPKDEDGSITGYADFGAAWEAYQLTRSKEKDTRVTDRQKELADRSMERGGTQGPTPKRPTPGFRGWMKDLQI